MRYTLSTDMGDNMMKGVKKVNPNLNLKKALGTTKGVDYELKAKYKVKPKMKY